MNLISSPCSPSTTPHPRGLPTATAASALCLAVFAWLLSGLCKNSIEKLLQHKNMLLLHKNVLLIHENMLALCRWRHYTFVRTSVWETVVPQQESPRSKLQCLSRSTLAPLAPASHQFHIFSFQILHFPPTLSFVLRVQVCRSLKPAEVEQEVELKLCHGRSQVSKPHWCCWGHLIKKGLFKCNNYEWIKYAGANHVEWAVFTRQWDWVRRVHL